MRRPRRHSTRVWVAASVTLHVGAAAALWQAIPDRSRPAAPNDPSISVSLVTRSAASVDAPAVEMPAPAVSAPPRPRPEPAPMPEPARTATPEPNPVAFAEPAPPAPPVEVAALESSSTAEAGVPMAAPPTADASGEPDPDPMHHYKTIVRSMIEARKRYPTMARRRGDEGLVIARIAIAEDGRLDAIDLKGRASNLLRRATRQAVERAAPFPPPPRTGAWIEIPVSWRVLD